MKLYMIVDDGIVETNHEDVIKRLHEEAENRGPKALDYFEEFGLGTLVAEKRFNALASELTILARWLKGCGIKEVITLHQRRERLVEDTLVARCLERLGGDKEIVTEIGYSDEDGHHVATDSSMLSDMLRQLHEDHRRHMRAHWRKERGYEPSPLRSFEKLSDVYEAFEGTVDDCLIFIGTVEQRAKREQERRRKELESLAAEIAHKHKVRLNTLGFLAAVDKELRQVREASEEWNNPEVRMEEWAACRYAGVGQDVYFDDLNFENGRINSRGDDLHSILEWVSENCPLLYAQYEEQKAATADEEDNDADGSA